MARVTNALLGENAFGRGLKAPVLDLTYGGQNGWSPVLSEIVSNQAYIRRNVFCVLLESPKFFTIMPEPAKWVQCLKSMVELHARSIEGLNAGLTVEVADHAVGGAGEMQSEVTDVKRERTEPVFGFIEKFGMPIQTFLYNWITYGIMDPDTKFALSSTVEGTKPTDALCDWYSMSCIFIEPDPSHLKVMKSWIVTGMFPKGTGEIVGKRDLTAASDVLELSIAFTGVAQFNLGANVFAQSILDSITLTNANPYLRPAMISAVTSDVAAATEGYKEGVATLAASAVTGAANL